MLMQISAKFDPMAVNAKDLKAALVTAGLDENSVKLGMARETDAKKGGGKNKAKSPAA